MRWLRWGLVAAWVGVHAALWASLPQLPRFVLWTDEYNPSLAPVGFTPDSSALVTADEDHVRVWDMTDGRLQSEWSGPGKPRHVRYLSPDSRTALASGWNEPGMLALLDLTTGVWTELPPINLAPYGEDGGRLFYPVAPPWFSPDSRTIAYPAAKSDTETFVIRLWDVAAARASEVELDGAGFSPAFAPDGHTLAVWTVDPDRAWHHVNLIDPATGRKVATMDTPAAEFVGQRFAPDGRILAVFGVKPPIGPGVSLKEQSWVQFWDVESRRLLATAHDAWLMDWAADGCLVAYGSEGIRRLDPHTGTDSAVWDTPDLSKRAFYHGNVAGRRLALVTVVDDPPAWLSWLGTKASLPDWLGSHPRESARLYDTLTGRERHAIWGWGQPTVSPDGRLLAKVNRGAPYNLDASVTVWDLPPRKPGGWVLALMLAQVVTLVAWTVWRRRTRRPRCAAG